MDHKISNKTIDKLKYDLVREGLLDYNQLVDAIELARTQQTNLVQILVQNDVINEESLLNFLEKKLHIPYVNLDDYTIDADIAMLISEEEAHKYKIIPIFLIEDTITIAMADPLDLFTLNNLIISSKYKVEPVICSERSILKIISTIYDNNKNTLATIDSPQKLSVESKFNWQSEFNEDQIDEVNMYRLIRAIIYQALQEKASDIHIEPHKDELLIRFRIDKLLQNRGSLPILIAQDFSSRIKSASGLDIKEYFVPQLGKLEVNLDKSLITARVATFPTAFGEKVVIKIFSNTLALDTLGMEIDQLEIFKNAITSNSGIIVGSGATGNGYLTTMYSILEYISSEHLNIMTIESPIYYNINNINQSQINISKNFDKITALNTVLLQDPDVIYLYELTELQSAELIIKAALSDKLILTSLTADSATGVINRLIKMGVDPKLLAKTINLTFNQRLIRVLCPECKTENILNLKIKEQFNIDENITIFKANGCSNCNNTGYNGITGIFEILKIDEIIKNTLIESNKITEPDNIIKNNRTGTLLENALAKVKNGITSLEEVLQVLNK